MNAAEIAILIKARDEASAIFNKVRGAAEGLGSKMGSVLKVGALAAAGGLGLAAVAAKAFVGDASDLNESMSKVDVVFGKNAKTVKDWAAKASTSMGQSKRQALEAAGTFGNLFDALGLTEDQMLSMSKSTVELATDLASFNNIGVDEALEKLRSGLVGEAEPLRALGVNINEATVKAKAMELGLADVSGELTDAAKVQARYALILEQTKNAQGDFARTSGGLANQQRILSAAFTDLKAGIGMALLPVLTSLTKLLIAEVVPALQSGVDAVTNFASVISSSLSGDITAAADAFNKLPAPLQAVAMWLGENKKAIEDFVRAAGTIALGVIVSSFEGWVTILKDLQPRLVEFGKWLNDHRPALIALAVAVGAISVAIGGWPILIAAAIVSIGLLVDNLRAWREENERVDTTMRAVEAILASVEMHINALVTALYYLGAAENQVFEFMRSRIEMVGEAAKTTFNVVLLPAFRALKYETEWIPGFFAGMGPIITGVRDDFAKIPDAIQWVIDRIYQLIEAIDRIPNPMDWLPNIPSLPGIKIPSFPGIPGFAAGGMTRGGMIMVGERGPEPAFLPRGTNIVSNSEARSILGGGSSVVNTFSVEVHVAGDATDATVDRMKREFREEMDQMVREADARGWTGMTGGGSHN